MRFLKRKALIDDLNVIIHVMFLISAGRLFHNFIAAALNDLSPRVAKHFPFWAQVLCYFVSVDCICLAA